MNAVWNRMASYRGVAIFSALFIVLYNASAQTIEDAPVIHTSVGSVRGLRAEDGDYSMFLGIPYAEVNKDNPFGASVPHPIFEETFDATDDSVICPQREEFNNTITGTLDCLHVNIYVPNSASTENPLPVLVWIHGGRWIIGFGNRYVYGPSYLVRHDVILVTLNYRLGPYGFMCLDIPEVPGNQGLKDQVMALRWIKENIASFGGDVNRITLSGNSAGSMSTDLHLYYDKEILFNRLALQSGVALVNTAVSESNPTAPIRLAQNLNYTPNDLNDALSFLATVNTDEIIAASPGLGFNPCVEMSFDNVESFITAHPVNVEPERVKDIDVLIGYNNNERYASFSRLDEESLANVDVVSNALDAHFAFGDEHELFEEMKKVVNQFYLGEDDITDESRQSMADIDSDFYFNHPTLRTVKRYIDNGAENLYLYLFSYSGGRNYAKHLRNITGPGAVHADEYGYQFDISYMDKPLDPEDELILDRMTLLWTNFVKYGNPTPTTTELVPEPWPRVTRDKWHYLEINTELRVATRPMHARMAFLDLFYKLNGQYQHNYERAPSAGSNIELHASLTLLLAMLYHM